MSGKKEKNKTKQRRKAAIGLEKRPCSNAAAATQRGGGGGAAAANSELASEAGGEKEEGDLHGCPCESYTLLLLTI